MGRIRVSYKDAREDYSKCRDLGTPGRGYRVVARENGIEPILFHRFFNGEHQEGLDSTDADEGSSNEESSTDDF